MKILWHSVAPWAGTGYGQQTATFVPRLIDYGHDVAISAFYGLGGSVLNWRGVPCYPPYGSAYGNDVIVTHALDHYGAHDETSFPVAACRGLVVTLCDVWVLDAEVISGMPVASWVPVDHDPLPPKVADYFAVSGAVPIAMSRFGERMLAQAGLKSLYVPHGIDTTIFTPGDRDESRQRLGIPEDAFVVAMVAANIGADPCRKAFAEQITAFAELRRRHSDAFLFLHTDIDSAVGVNIRDMVADLPTGSYKWTPQYPYRKGLPPQYVADVHRAADVLSNTSYGEGFGIPIIEAQACGTPVIVTDATSMPELCGSGWVVPGERSWHNAQRSWFVKPAVADIVDAYQDAYADTVDRTYEARDFAAQYDADVVTEMHWKPALASLESMLKERQNEVATPMPIDLPITIREADGYLWVDRGMSTDDGIGWQPHEANLEPTLRELLPDGGVFLDVGAHVGRWSIRLASRASDVWAVEANPATASILRRNLAINDISNVHVVATAAWDEPARMRLEDPNGKVTGGSTRTLVDDGGHVDANRLDHVLDGMLPRLDLVKLDVEGADIHALRGMSKLLDEHRPVLFVECHDIYGYYERADLEGVLRELGYGWRADTLHYGGAEYLVCEPVGP